MVQAISAFRHIVGTEEFRQLERMREGRLNDEKAALSYAKRMGREEGRKEAFVSVARSMKAGGIDEKTIAEITGLSVADIFKL